MGLVRIVGGALRGRRLSVPERGVRPTSERAREAIFDILGPRLVTGARVLDLYAGTGALGIEALSRGARSADFVEKSPEIARRLARNLRELGFGEEARVHEGDLDRAELPGHLSGTWRLVFLDPPYDGDAGPRWVEALARASCLDPDGIVIYERRKGASAPSPSAFTLATERTYGDTTVAFYRAGGPPGAPGEGEP
ncbi:MAG TPA: 16S rRNA (guanine(966)-N(2))-methyltransferase RsmD [Candidatus Eisenbacteria bacterium]|nr:16S rRNA (guanine(966)-N(2))-methyltransferase RsmD [Candidatus Eisenbacteria bacterium]